MGVGIVRFWTSAGVGGVEEFFSFLRIVIDWNGFATLLGGKYMYCVLL